MAKFMRLINNEWRKLFFKAGTWVMLVFICVLAIGSTALSLLGQWILSDVSFDDSMQSYFESEAEYYEGLLKNADESLPEDVLAWQIELRYYRLLLELEITESTDWRYTSGAVYEAVELQCRGELVTYQKYLEILQNKDAGGYFALQKELMQLVFVGEQLEIYTEALDYCIQNELIPSSETDARYALVGRVIENREILLQQRLLQESGGAWSKKTVEKAQNALAIARYQLENNMLANPADSFVKDWNEMYIGDGILKKTSPFWDNLKQGVGLFAVIAYFCIVIAGNSIAKEYADGTIKFLLIAPVTRRKILFSKYATVVSVTGLMTVLLFVFSLLSSFVFGVGDLLLPAVYAEGGNIVTVSPILMLIGEYALAFLQAIVMATLAFAISSMTKSASLASGIGLVSYMMGPTVTSILQLLDIDGARYLIFANLDLAAIASGTSMFPHQSLPVAIGIILAYLGVFLFIAHDGFVRREL